MQWYTGIIFKVHCTCASVYYKMHLTNITHVLQDWKLIGVILDELMFYQLALWTSKIDLWDKNIKMDLIERPLMIMLVVEKQYMV